MSSITITNESTQLPNYGVSVQRSGISNLVSQSSSDGIALFNSLKSDMLTNWTLYNGTPESGNEIKIQTSSDSAAINLTKQFFTLVGDSASYEGSANWSYSEGFTTFSNSSGNRKQHVLIFETTDAMSPPTSNIRQINQKYRVRLEYDERERLSKLNETRNSQNAFVHDEYERELYQLNLRLKSMGRAQYIEGAVIDETDTSKHQLEAQVLPGALGPKNWTESDGIPNCQYGWVKINIATVNQLPDDGNMSSMANQDSGLIQLESGAVLETSVIRTPGECVDVTFEDLVIPSKALVFPYDGSTEFTVGEVISGQGGAQATVHSTTVSNNNLLVTYTNWNDRDFVEGEDVTGTDSTVTLELSLITTEINRSKRFRNKKKGKGWFKRFGSTTPLSYRLTMTERGFVLYLYESGEIDSDYAWVCCQRTVDNTEGTAPTDESSRYPVHVLYSCSRDSTYSRDYGLYFSEDAANLQTAETVVDTVYDSSGNTYSLNSLTNDSFFIVSPYDREDYLADEYNAKLIWRFVARELDITRPWEVHKLATRHQIDSSAIINPLEQLAITNDNRFVITFPTGLTTQRFMYPKEEIDLICFSSAEVVAESSNVPMNTYVPSGNTDNRRYQGMRSTLVNGNGMRIMLLVNGRHIFNTDVNIGTDTSGNLLPQP